METEQTNNSNPSQQRPQAENDYEHEVFVSYAWGNESERIVDKLEQAFAAHGIHIVRDKKDLDYKGSIEEFEERIGRGQCVVLVISDKYLRSKHCMYELLRVSQNKELRKRIFPIVLTDAEIYDAEGRLNYFEHWDEKAENLNNSIKERVRRLSNIKGLTGDLERYESIRDNFDSLMRTLQDMNAWTPGMHAKDKYSRLIRAVQDLMAEEKPEPKQGTMSFPQPEEMPEPQPQPAPRPKPEPTPPPVHPGLPKWILAAVAVLGVAVVALLIAQFRPQGNTPVPQASPTSRVLSTEIPTQASTLTLELPPTEPETISLPPCTEKSKTRYGFDCGNTLWAASGDPDIQAVTSVTTSQVPNRDRTPSTVLALTVDFTGDRQTRKDDKRELGEVQVTLSDDPPAGYGLDLIDDLAGKTIVAYVWAARGASGDPQYLNGFQLFLRDRESHSCYGDWTNIQPGNEEKWFRVTWREPTMDEKLAESEEAQKEGKKPKCHPEFNINEPMILGLKIAVGERSTIEYKEPFTIYLDDIDWLSDTHVP